jgi:hypothetical protein
MPLPLAHGSSSTLRKIYRPTFREKGKLPCVAKIQKQHFVATKADESRIALAPEHQSEKLLKLAGV